MSFDAQASAEALKAKSTKIIMLPNAQVEIKIRKLTVYDFMEGNMDIPVGPMTSANTAERVSKSIAKVTESSEKLLELILARAIVSPRVVIDSDKEAGEDEIHAYDLGADVVYIIEQVVEFSGLGEAAAKAANFRKDEEK